MELREYMVGQEIMVSPAEGETEDGKKLFQHCANGHTEVYKNVFEKEVEPLLIMHGVSFITTDLEHRTEVRQHERE